MPQPKLDALNLAGPLWFQWCPNFKASFLADVGYQYIRKNSRQKTMESGMDHVGLRAKFYLNPKFMKQKQIHM